MSFCVLFFLLLDCRCFPAYFHLGLHPATGLSLKCGVFLSPDHLLCIESRSQLTRRAYGEAATAPPLVSLCGTVNNPTLHLWGIREVWGGMWVCGMELCCAGDVH